MGFVADAASASSGKFVPDASSAGNPPDSKDPYADMSFIQKVGNDLKLAAKSAKRLGLLGVKTFNDTIARTAAIPVDASIELYNHLTRSDVEEEGSAWQRASDADIAPAQNMPEELFTAGVSGATAMFSPGGAEAKLASRAPSSIETSANIARSSGYKMAPSEIPGSPRITKLAERLSGSKQTAAKATESNVSRLSENMATEFGMPKGTEINPDTLGAVISHAGESYGDISRLGAGYQEAIESVKEYRNLANRYYKQSATNYSVEAEQKAEDFRSKADRIDGIILDALKAEGKQDMFTKYTDSRRTIAKAYDAMRALVKSKGELDPKSFSKSYGKDRPLSGELLNAGRSAEAFPDSFNTQAPKGISKYNNLDNWLLGSGVGLYELSHNPKLATAALGAGAAKTGIRAALLSNPMQDYMTLPEEQRSAAMLESLVRGGIAGQGDSQ